jgi:hypothetical protein
MDEHVWLPPRQTDRQLDKKMVSMKAWTAHRRTIGRNDGHGGDDLIAAQADKLDEKMVVMIWPGRLSGDQVRKLPEQPVVDGQHSPATIAVILS